MRRERLRPMPTQADLDRMYAVPHNHYEYRDHQQRVDAMIRMAAAALKPGERVADLSCGNAAVATALQESHGAQLTLGDIAPGYELHGPIEQTIHEIEPVDMFICGETIEHLDDPDAVLRDIRPKTTFLMLSTPDSEFDDRNTQHVHGWDAEAVEKMLVDAGFTPLKYELVDMRPLNFIYAFQVWLAW